MVPRCSTFIPSRQNTLQDAIYVGSVCCFAPLTTSSRFVDYILGPALLATQSSKTHTHTHTPRTAHSVLRLPYSYLARRAGTSAGAPVAPKSKSDKRMAGALRKLPPLPSGAASAAAATAAAGGRPDKVIIFSQWTSMLDLLEIPLRKAKIHLRRLDGTMTVPNRERAIQDFESKPEVMVLLVGWLVVGRVDLTWLDWLVVALMR